MNRGSTLIKSVATLALVASMAAVGCSNDRSSSGPREVPPQDGRSAGKSGGDIHAGSGARASRNDRAPVDTSNNWKVDDEKVLPKSPLRTARPGECIPAGMVTSSMAFPTGERSTSAVVVAKGLPPQVVKNQEFDYVICVSNITAGDLNNVVLSDELSNGFNIVSASPNFDGRSGGAYVWELGDMAAGETRAINIRARATSGDMIDACAQVSYNSAVCVAAKVVEPALQLVKNGPSQVTACDDIVYTYRVTNSGTGAATNVVITDDLPNGVTTKDGRRNVSFDVGTLAAGQSRDFSVATSASRTGRVENTAQATASPGLKAESGTVITNIVKPVLEITQRCDDFQYIGRNADMDITVTNSGNGVAKNTVVEATLAGGTSFVSASDNGRLAGNKVVWNFGDLAPKAKRSVNLVYTSAAGGNFRTPVVANAVCADPVSENCSTEYRGIPAILVECIDLEDPDEVGTTETYVITVTNQGSAPDSNIRLMCKIPNSMSYESSTGPTQGTNRGQTLTFAPLASLAPKAQAVWRVVVMGNEPGQVRFEIQVTSDQFKDPPIMETEATNLYE